MTKDTTAGGVDAVREMLLLRIKVLETPPRSARKDFAIEELRFVLDRAPPATGDGAGVAFYRFLELGDLIEAGDECPSDNCERWEAVNRWAIGQPRSSIFKIIRRKVAASPAPAPAAEAETGEWFDVEAPALPRDDDRAYPIVRDAVLEAADPSAQFIQRRFMVGFNRASRFIERMERENLISGWRATGGRTVIAPSPKAGETG